MTAVKKRLKNFIHQHLKDTFDSCSWIQPERSITLI